MASNTTTTKGIWWLQSQPDKRLQGEGTYGPTSGAEVDLFGHPYESFDDKKLIERFTLHGLTFKARPISLFGCMVTGGEINLPGGRSCKIRSVSGVVGGHYCSLDEVFFKEVRVQFKGLVEWTCTSGITLKVEETPQGIAMSYHVPLTIPLGKFGPFSIRINFTAHAKPGFHSFGIEEDCLLIIEAEQMQPYLAFEDYILSFQRFLCLAIQRATTPTEITGRIDKPREVLQNTPIFEDFLIIRRLTEPDWTGENLVPQHMLFTLRELSCPPAEVFGKYLDREKVLMASMDLYFSTIYSDSCIPRVDFLTLAQSLEAYHRAVLPGKYTTDEHYNIGLRKRLWAAVQSDDEPVHADFRASLSKKLDYLHEFSLNKRLKEIAKKHGPVLDQFIGSPDVFSKQVSELRNKLTHPAEEPVESGAGYPELLRLSEKMALLLEVCFLDEMGFSQERLKEMILNRSRRAYRVHRGWV
jgi:hypothetical protein